MVDAAQHAPTRTIPARSIRTHAPAGLFFAALTVLWTWPLAPHLDTSLAGHPGDNYSFIWNLWWVRRVLSTPGLHYFHTSYLFYPFGVNIADHPNTALPAFIAATLLEPLSLVSAQNVLLLFYVFAGLVCTYALVWDLTRAATLSILCATIFGISPYIGAHLLGHFDLVAAWTLPLYALALRWAMRGPRHLWSAVAAGIVAAATAYTAYYYVVYLAVFTVVLVAMESASFRFRASRAVRGRQRYLSSVALLAMAAVLLATAAIIGATGGGTFAAAGLKISAHTPQNALSAMWVLLALSAVLFWLPRVSVHRTQAASVQAATVVSIVAAVFAILASPLIWQAIVLAVHHQYVSPLYVWRNIPHGVDLIAPLLGNPRHPVFGRASAHAYHALHQDAIEAIGWIGVAPPLLLLWTSRSALKSRAGRVWFAVLLVFGVWSLGPVLTVAGFDTGLKLPAILLRYVPFVANARMPGRAIVMVYLAIAVLIACGVRETTGLVSSPLVHGLLIAIVIFSYWDAPIPLTTPQRPPIYATLAAAPPGPVCEVPFGIGDGLGPGLGAQDRVALFYATLHGHPLVGGFIGRMPSDAPAEYFRTPIVGDLLKLSGDGSTRLASVAVPARVSGCPCRYLVVHRDASPASLLRYVDALPAQRVARSGGDELYRLW